MSLHAQPLETIPELTSRIAHTSFPKGTLAMHLRDALGPIYQDADFAHLFPRRGRAAEAPWRLALITILQAAENLSDRQAAEMVQGGSVSQNNKLSVEKKRSWLSVQFSELEMLTPRKRATKGARQIVRRVDRIMLYAIGESKLAKGLVNRQAISYTLLEKRE